MESYLFICLFDRDNAQLLSSTRVSTSYTSTVLFKTLRRECFHYLTLYISTFLQLFDCYSYFVREDYTNLTYNTRIQYDLLLYLVTFK